MPLVYMYTGGDDNSNQQMSIEYGCPEGWIHVTTDLEGEL